MRPTAFVLLLSITAAANAASNFFDTCYDCVYTSLQADYGSQITLSCNDCRDKNGNGRASQLSMNHCVINNNGQMTGQKEGGFDSSCGHPSRQWNGRGFSATCKNTGGGTDVSTIDMSYFVGNDNGVLNCYGIYGS